MQSGKCFYWDGFLRADKHVCDPANTLLWRRGGFYRAKLGVESGSLKILEKMGKKITLQQIKDAVSSLAYAGIKTTTFWVIGHPGETEEDFHMTLERVNRFIRHCRKLGIPNPYLLDDIHDADQRWKKLYKNAVPALMDLRDKKNHLHESKQIKELSLAENLLQEDSDWLL